MTDWSNESEGDRYDEAVRRLHDAVQSLLSDGVLRGDMLTHWYFVGSALTAEPSPDPDDMNSVSIILSDGEATLPDSLGLVRAAEIGLEEEVREWYSNE